MPPEYWDWGHWFRHLFTGKPGMVLGEGEKPYLRRFYVLPRNPFFNVYVHHFLRSDDDRALHDHPWWFVSLILKGGYWEHRENKAITARSWRSSGSIAVRRPDTLHRVELGTQIRNGDCWTMYHYEAPAWTLIATGPKVREWGFKCPKGWLHWKEFTHRNGCGE